MQKPKSPLSTQTGQPQWTRRFRLNQDESRYISINQGEHPIFISPDRFLRHARVWVSDVRRANAPFSFYFSMI